MSSQSRLTLGEFGNCVSMAAPTNSGESDIAIGQVDETIYFNFPRSPPDFPPLSLPCFPPSSPNFPPLSPPYFPPSPPYSPPFSPPQNFRPSSNSMVVHQQRSNQSTENPPQDLLRLYGDISDTGPSTFPPSGPPPPFPPSSDTMVVHPPENLLLYEDVSNTCLPTFPPPPPFPPLSNSMFVYPRSEQSMGRPPQNLRYEDIFDTSWNLDEDLFTAKLLARYIMDINGINRLYRGVGQGDGGKWVAQIRIQRKLVSVGRFNCPEDAAVARDLLAFKLKGDKARLNFPEHLEVIKRKAEILQQLRPTAHEENPDEDSDEDEDEDSDSNEMGPARFTEIQLQNLQQSGKSVVVSLASDNFNENSPENQQHECIIGISGYFDSKSALWKMKLLLYMNDAFNFMSREELMTILMSEDSVLNDFFLIEMRRRDGSKWESKIRVGWNWLSIGTFDAVTLGSKGAIFKLREDKARLSSRKLFLIFCPSSCPFCPGHGLKISRLLQLLPTAQRETPDEYFWH
ncbi:hypothetical protein RHMOL_Rhmol02G0042100 [Rhododendron molle]|uniref:Uncharacterized protein n=1 Tax=Rhododendron molle TaxID=49168 RepID=A0ACC0PLP8_RHOML|nr:hypothetical protein RHMOL_Rhmol02G0042100 [Rhododendron molle]